MADRERLKKGSVNLSFIGHTRYVALSSCCCYELSSNPEKHIQRRFEMNTDVFPSNPKLVYLTPAGRSCKSRLGESGWAVILRHKNHSRVLSGHSKTRSELRMEIMAVINGLNALKEPCCVFIRTFSEFLAHGMRSMRRQRASDRWRASVLQGIAKNSDLWMSFREASKRHVIELDWIPYRSKDLEATKAIGFARGARSWR